MQIDSPGLELGEGEISRVIKQTANAFALS